MHIEIKTVARMFAYITVPTASNKFWYWSICKDVFGRIYDKIFLRLYELKLGIE